MNFKNWLDSQLKKEMPEGIVAFNFNLYESERSDTDFDAQLVGCHRYDADDPDWACEAIFSSEEDLYSFQAADWETAQNDFEELVVAYLKTCPPSSPLRAVKHIACGFVDGDLDEI